MPQWLTSSYSVRKRYSYGITRTLLVQQKDSFIQKLALKTQNGVVLIVSRILYMILLYEGLMEGHCKT